MDNSSFTHHDGQGYPSGQRAGHWSPALRPNTDLDLRRRTPSTEPVISAKHQQMLDIPYQSSFSYDVQIEKPGESGFLGSSANAQLDSESENSDIESSQILDGARRSASFPRLAEGTSSAASVPHIYGSSDQRENIEFNDLLQGESIQEKDRLLEKESDEEEEFDEEDEQTEVRASGDDVSKDTRHQTEHTVSTSLPIEGIFESNVHAVDSSALRYEEGIPLINTTFDDINEAIPSATQDVLHTDLFEMTADEDNEASFFSQIQDGSVSTEARQILQRKSTDEVIDAVHEDKWEQLFVDDKAAQFSVMQPSDMEMSPEDHFAEQASETPVPTLETTSKWADILEDDEFLVEDADDLLPDSEPESPSSFIAALKDDNPEIASSTGDMAQSGQMPTTIPQTPTNQYAPHQPSTSDMMQLSPKAHGNIGITRAGLGPMGSFQNHIQQPAIINRSESFVDQKGGYKSPYDLPLELSKPKKRQQTQRASSQPQKGILPPPPRSMSINAQDSNAPTKSTPSQSVTSPATSTPSVNRNFTAPASSSTAKPVKKTSTSSFFEELPMVPKQRPAGRVPPPQPTVKEPPVLKQATSSTQLPVVANQDYMLQTRNVTDPYAQYQLQPPERVDPYANLGLQPPAVPSTTVVTNRYSPAPAANTSASRPSSTPRYSPAPAQQTTNVPNRYASQPATAPPPQATANPLASQSVQPLPAPNTISSYLPRTSSPLAYHGKPSAEHDNALMPPPPIPRSTQTASAQPPARQTTPPSVPPPPQASYLHFSPPKPSDAITPPRRSQTQSPSRQMARSALRVPLESGNNRPASAVGQISMAKELNSSSATISTWSTRLPRATVPELDFEIPQDETRNDQLQRWRGAPVFHFGFGGVIVTSFPKHTPRYKPGQIKPQVKSTAGEVKTRFLKDLSILPEHVISFPGPLKAKSKKKELLIWMASTIAKLENEAPTTLGDVQTVPDPRTCHEELVLLWKVVKIFVEHDGSIDGKPDALKALNVLLSPEVHAIDESSASQYRSATELTGIYSPAGANVRSDVVDPLAVEALRKHLLRGEREQAVWKAADNRLWSHALLLASTFRDDGKTWRQVIQEFVRQEVKTIGNNSEALSALYEIFAGNMEESIDQLVPPSARAGLQMVSKVDSSGPTKNALDGLNRWKETLGLVLNNRTPDDQRALATLGALLGNYGRVQAAHICFLFARNPLSPSVFGGIDDAQANITLLGSDRRANPLTFHQDRDAILLTEAYEFAISVLAPSPMSVSLPHLSAYKLQRALDLADNGLKTEAQAYCDAVTSGITSKNKMSPYYNATLLTEVDDLAKRLKQVPVQSASWLAKPSVERATSSLLSKITNFVAGDDSDAESKGSGADVGPFAKTSGSPGLSRSGSQTDLYGMYPGMTPVASMTAAGSRYHPGGIVSPRSSTDLTRGRASFESQRSPPATSHSHEPRQSLFTPATMNQMSQSPARSVNSFQNLGTSPSYSNFQPSPPQPLYLPNGSATHISSLKEEESSDALFPTGGINEPSIQRSFLPDQDSQRMFQQPAHGGFNSSVPPADEASELLPEKSEDADYGQTQSYGYGYEPPADTGYVPYQPDPDSDDEDNAQKKKKQPAKKKSFMDDDDEYSKLSVGAGRAINRAQDDSGATAAAKKKANDEAADAAFRAAAEADEQRAKEQAAQKKAGGGWLGGWFGGKKPESLDAPKSSGNVDSKVYKAKLGEDKMKLYYDKDLKKWVNPDDPDSMKTKATPPPPPPGRSSAPPTAAGPPRMGGTPAPPLASSRVGTPASIAGTETQNTGLGIGGTLAPSVNVGLNLPSSAGTPPPLGSSSGATAPPPSLGGLVPPSRPASNASSIDDLIGPASGTRKGAKGARGAKKGRYVDVMAQ